jgi:hypothetical protein
MKQHYQRTKVTRFHLQSRSYPQLNQSYKLVESCACRHSALKCLVYYLLGTENNEDKESNFKNQFGFMKYPTR